jgi:mannose-6-phosphate isomerase-like protein (cupin superfamily)
MKAFDMSSPILVTPLLGNVIGSADSLIVAEWQDPGGQTSKEHPIAPLHVHHHDDEIWYVLEGSLCVQLEDAEIEAHAGSAVLAPKGTAHTFWNPGPGPVRYLMFMTSLPLPETRF